MPLAAPTTIAVFFSSVNAGSIMTASSRHSVRYAHPSRRGHGRYEYSNITKRPDYAWPGGRRLAVYVALNIEGFAFGVGKGAAIAPPDQAQTHSVYSWRDYGNRVGIWRLYEMAPDIPEKLRARGDEILGHGVTNSDEQGHLAEDQERALIENVTATIAQHEGAKPVGWMSPCGSRRARAASSRCRTRSR